MPFIQLKIRSSGKTEEQETERQGNPNLMAVRSCCIVNKNGDIQNNSEPVFFSSFFLVWWYPGSVLTVFLHSFCVASLLTKKSDSVGNGWLRFFQSDASPMRQDGLRRSVTLFIHTDSFRCSSTMLAEGIKGFG